MVQVKVDLKRWMNFVDHFDAEHRDRYCVSKTYPMYSLSSLIKQHWGLDYRADGVSQIVVLEFNNEKKATEFVLKYG